MIVLGRPSLLLLLLLLFNLAFCAPFASRLRRPGGQSGQRPWGAAHGQQVSRSGQTNEWTRVGAQTVCPAEADVAGPLSRSCRPDHRPPAGRRMIQQVGVYGVPAAGGRGTKCLRRGRLSSLPALSLMDSARRAEPWPGAPLIDPFIGVAADIAPEIEWTTFIAPPLVAQLVAAGRAGGRRGNLGP